MGSLLNSKEQTFFDQTSIEVLTLAGTDTPVLWKFNKTGGATAATIDGVSGLIDCLYEEPRIPSQAGVKGTPSAKLFLYTPYNVLCFFERPQFINNATEMGLQQRSEGKMWFSRKNLESVNVPLNSLGYHLDAGDIIELWSKTAKIPWYFEMINVERDGFEHDSSIWTHYECEVVRNESFSPERKL